MKRINGRIHGKIVLLVMLVVVGLVISANWYGSQKDNDKQDQHSISNFDDCIAAGHLMLKSDPPKCEANGHIFTATD